MKLKSPHLYYQDYKDEFDRDGHKMNREGSNNKKLKNKKMMDKEDRA